jgi:hypothetical protein
VKIDFAVGLLFKEGSVTSKEVQYKKNQKEMMAINLKTTREMTTEHLNNGCEYRWMQRPWKEQEI